VGLLSALAQSPCPCEVPRKEVPAPRPRYGLPLELVSQQFIFAGEKVPIDRKDVRARILSQVNFLLLDARSVLSSWLTEDMKYTWIYQEILTKEGIPKEFAVLAPILSRMRRTGDKGHQGGIWALDKPCGAKQGLAMSSDDWHDDEMDLDLSTRCFAAQIKEIRKQLGDRSWLMAAAAYMTSLKNIEDLKRTWDTKSYWDLPLPENPDVLIPRWIALWIIHAHRSTYHLNLRPAQPLTFDQVTGVVLAKDLPVAEIARITGAPPRLILELNPKIKPGVGLFSARKNGKRTVHTIAAPRGKGPVLVKGLKDEGFLATGPGK
jgi:hypothetical protein